MRMRKIRHTLAALTGLVLLGSIANAAMPTDEQIAQAARNPALIGSIMRGTSAEEAAQIATHLVEKIIAGDFRDMIKRLRAIAAASIGASGENGPAVAAALVKAAGDAYEKLVVAAITVAAQKVSPNADAVIEAAIDAAGDKEAAKEAAENPRGTLGWTGVLSVERRALATKRSCIGAAAPAVPTADPVSAPMDVEALTGEAPTQPPQPRPARPTPTPVGKF